MSYTGSNDKDDSDDDKSSSDHSLNVKEFNKKYAKSDITFKYLINEIQKNNLIYNIKEDKIYIVKDVKENDSDDSDKIPIITIEEYKKDNKKTKDNKQKKNKKEKKLNESDEDEDDKEDKKEQENDKIKESQIKDETEKDKNLNQKELLKEETIEISLKEDKENNNKDDLKEDKIETKVDNEQNKNEDQPDKDKEKVEDNLDDNKNDKDDNIKTTNNDLKQIEETNNDKDKKSSNQEENEDNKDAENKIKKSTKKNKEDSDLSDNDEEIEKSEEDENDKDSKCGKEENNDDGKNDEKEDLKDKPNSENSENDKKEINKQPNEKLKKSKSKSKTKKNKDKDKSKMKITLDNFSDFTLERDVKLYYFNYLNKYFQISYPVKINESYMDFINSFCSTYNCDSKDIKVVRKIKGQKIKFKSFANFDFINDYFIIIEKANNKSQRYEINLDKHNMDSDDKVTTENLENVERNHLVIFKSNFKIDKIQLFKAAYLNLLIYKLPINTFSDYRKSTLINESKNLFLKEWKNKAELVYNIKTFNNVIIHEYNIITREFTINDIYMKKYVPYIFSLQIPGKNIGSFNYRDFSSQDISIFSDSSHIYFSEFSGKKVSDLVVQ